MRQLNGTVFIPTPLKMTMILAKKKIRAWKILLMSSIVRRAVIKVRMEKAVRDLKKKAQKDNKIRRRTILAFRFTIKALLILEKLV